MKKKGSHVGMMLSFVIFITFLVFLYSIISPVIETEQDKESVLNSLEIELENMFDSELTTFTIQIGGGQINPSENCFNLQNIITDINEQGIDEEKLIIKDENHDILNYKTSGQSLVIETGTGFSGFLKFYYSEELQPSFCEECSIGGCGYLTSYTSLIKTANETHTAKIDEAIEKYNSDYEGLKTELKVPDRNEFAFSFENNEGNVTEPTYETPSALSVYAEKNQILYIDEDGNTKLGFLTIKVW